MRDLIGQGSSKASVACRVGGIVICALGGRGCGGFLAGAKGLFDSEELLGRQRRRRRNGTHDDLQVESGPCETRDTSLRSVTKGPSPSLLRHRPHRHISSRPGFCLRDLRQLLPATFCLLSFLWTVSQTTKPNSNGYHQSAIGFHELRFPADEGSPLPAPLLDGSLAKEKVSAAVMRRPREPLSLVLSLALRDLPSVPLYQPAAFLAVSATAASATGGRSDVLRHTYVVLPVIISPLSLARYLRTSTTATAGSPSCAGLNRLPFLHFSGNLRVAHAAHYGKNL